jgi:hypothetical protein
VFAPKWGRSRSADPAATVLMCPGIAIPARERWCLYRSVSLIETLRLIESDSHLHPV